MSDKTEQLKVANQNIVNGLLSKNASTRDKTAADMGDYMKLRLWEDSLIRNVMDYQQYTSADLDPQLDIEEPVKLVYFEPHVPKAYSVPFSDDANATAFSGRRSAILFQPITSSKFRNSKFMLMSDPGDIRSFLTDKTKFELLDVEDSRNFSMIDAFVGTADNLPPLSEVDNPIHRTIYGGFTPETFVEICNILPRARDFSGIHFGTHTIVMNRLLASKFKTWDNVTFSDDTLKEVEEKGWTRGSYQDYEIIVTAKTHIVAENEVYTIGPRKQAGKAGMLEDISLFTDAEGQFLEWYAQWVPGSVLNPYCWGKATIQGL